MKKLRPKRLSDLPKIPQLTSGINRTLIQTLCCPATKFLHLPPYHPACLTERVNFLSFFAGRNKLYGELLFVLSSRWYLKFSCIHFQTVFTEINISGLTCYSPPLSSPAPTLLPQFHPYNRWDVWNVTWSLSECLYDFPLPSKFKL